MDIQISRKAGIAVESTGASCGNVELYVTVLNILIVVTIIMDLLRTFLAD